MKTNKLKKDFLFISPSLTGVLIFFIIPFGVVIYYSGIDGVVSRNPVGLGNYVNLMRNTAFQNAAKNTAVFSLFRTGTADVSA